MSYLASGSLGLMAGVLALGAVHLEVSAGNDLLGPVQRGDASMTLPARAVADAQATNVDRSGKGDRELFAKPAGGITMSFKVPGIDDTSIMMRVPASQAVGPADPRSEPASTLGSSKGSSAAARPVACEPVVSVLTAVAKQLAPGRCVT